MKRRPRRQQHEDFDMEIPACDVGFGLDRREADGQSRAGIAARTLQRRDHDIIRASWRLGNWRINTSRFGLP